MNFAQRLRGFHDTGIELRRRRYHEILELCCHEMTMRASNGLYMYFEPLPPASPPPRQLDNDLELDINPTDPVSTMNFTVGLMRSNPRYNHLFDETLVAICVLLGRIGGRFIVDDFEVMWCHNLFRTKVVKAIVVFALAYVGSRSIAVSTLFATAYFILGPRSAIDANSTSTKDLNNHHHYRNSVARSGGKKKSRVSVHKQHGRGSGRKSRISRQRGRGSGKKYHKHSKRQPGGKKSSKKRRSSKRKGKRGGNGGCPVDANGRVDFACPICGKTHKLSSNQFHIESIRVPSGDGADRYQSQIVVPVCPGCGTQNLRQFCSSA
ncbi:uncharacterized protein BJ171DRAFT_606848 [Polychytrium aggregatum]|uniref:uncharacterized protein n=1 Tax=Polychytrium aggregatum TaxID=110093 RepID=UPI0022FDC529|nr:uncharacterized protein BJ171DRAFT_606848 [Polychytrium aggregatum]KAI9190608.1 hypothetical protein BJ171DRAFT_606848 [Polychytrium aggregatum]